MTDTAFTPSGLDALPPAEVARKAEAVGVTKAGLDAANVFVLSILALVFVAATWLRRRKRTVEVFE